MREDLRQLPCAARPVAVLQTKQDEVKLLIQYLQKHEFFKDLPSAILARGSIQMKTKGCVEKKKARMRFWETGPCARELYATSAIVRTDAMALTISDAAFNLSACFCEGIGTCGNANHLSGLSADTPTLTHLDLVGRSCKARLLDKLDSATLKTLSNELRQYGRSGPITGSRRDVLPLLGSMKPRGP